MAVRLSVHKNTVARRRKKERATVMSKAAADMCRVHDVRAYAIVGIACDGRAYASWDTGRALPMWAFADTVATVLRKDIETCEVEDDWRPPGG